MSCDAAGLAALSHLTSLETLKLSDLAYREKGPAGRWLYEAGRARLESRLWDMIKARRAGKPLDTAWLTAYADARTAARERKAKALEAEAQALLDKIAALKKEAQALLDEAKRVRAGT